MDSPTEGNNGRITLAVLGQKLDALTDDVSDLVQMFRADHDKLTEVCTKWQDLDTLKKAVIGNIVAVIATAVAAILALIGQAQ